MDDFSWQKWVATWCKVVTKLLRFTVTGQRSLGIVSQSEVTTSAPHFQVKPVTLLDRFGNP